MIKTERDFCQMCKKRGFTRRAPHFYARCIGDGIFQTIYTGFKKYISPDSPSYSSENRKSYYICIGLRSIYSNYHEHVFSSDKDSGGYVPADLIHKRKYSGPFNGIEEDYYYMFCRGFDVLDSITTQEKLIEWWDSVQVIDTGHRIHDIHLVEPLLLCGNLDDAENEISVSFIQDMDAYISYRTHVECGRIHEENSYEQRIWQNAREALILWRWCIGRNQKELCAYFNENYKRNMGWIHKYGIPTIQLTPPRTLVNM